MATPSLATVAALREWTGAAIAGADVGRANRYLSAASSLVRSTAGQTWLTDDETPALTAVPDEIVNVVLQVTARLWNNPTGVIHETAGPFSQRWAEDAGQGLYLTDTERDIVERFRPTGGLFTMSTTRGELETETYIPVTGSDKPLPVSGP